MYKRFLQYKDASICYYIYGSGNQIAFCFHGYSNNARIFELLEAPLGDRFRLIAIDLPFHGETSWPRSRLTEIVLTEIIDLILAAEALPQKYWLVGFSLGCRVCIKLFTFRPAPVVRMILLSPDGLYNSIWYRFLVRTATGHKLMAFLLKSPRKAMPVLDWCRKLNIINTSVYNYACSFVHSKRESTLLFVRWVSMSKLHPNMKLFNSRMLERGIQVSIVFGKKDQITPRQNAQELRRFHNKYLHIALWDAGHLLLREKYLPKLLPLFESRN